MKNTLLLLIFKHYICTLSSEYGIHCLELMHFHKALLLLFSELSLITHTHVILAIALCAKQPSGHTRLENEGSMHCKLANLLVASVIGHFIVSVYILVLYQYWY